MIKVLDALLKRSAICCFICLPFQFVLGSCNDADNTSSKMTGNVANPTSQPTIAIQDFSFKKGDLTLHLLNNTRNETRVFQTPYSWGAFAYSFKIHANGKVYEIHRKTDLRFTRNGPDFWALHTGSNELVFSLSDGTWEGWSSIAGIEQNSITELEMSYRTNPTPESVKLSVDVGPITLDYLPKQQK